MSKEIKNQHYDDIIKDYVHLINLREKHLKPATAARCALTLLRIRGLPITKPYITNILNELDSAGAAFDHESAFIRAHHVAQFFDEGMGWRYALR